MKVAKLFLVGAIALGLGLTACNNEVENFTDKPEATVSVKIVQDANPGTRATGDLTDPGVKPKWIGCGIGRKENASMGIRRKHA